MAAADAICAAIEGRLLDAGWWRGHRGFISPTRPDLYGVPILLATTVYTASLQPGMEEAQWLIDAFMAYADENDFVTVPDAHAEFITWTAGVYHGPAHVIGPVEELA